MNRTVIKIGNSLGMTLPKEILKELDVKQGDTLNLVKEDGQYILGKKENIQVRADMDINQKFIDGYESLINDYDSSLKELSE